MGRPSLISCTDQGWFQTTHQHHASGANLEIGHCPEIAPCISNEVVSISEVQYLELNRDVGASGFQMVTGLKTRTKPFRKMRKTISICVHFPSVWVVFFGNFKIYRARDWLVPECEPHRMSEALQPHGITVPWDTRGCWWTDGSSWMFFGTLPHCLRPPLWFSFSSKEALKMIIVALIEIVQASAPTIFHVDAMAWTHFGAIHRHESKCTVSKNHGSDGLVLLKPFYVYVFCPVHFWLHGLHCGCQSVCLCVCACVCLKATFAIFFWRTAVFFSSNVVVILDYLLLWSLFSSSSPLRLMRETQRIFIGYMSIWDDVKCPTNCWLGGRRFYNFDFPHYC